VADEPAKSEVAQTEPAKSVAKSGKPTMAIKVYAPFKVYYEGEGYRVSAVNATGPFDILPHHHNFLCMLLPCDLEVESPDGVKTYKIQRALMYVKSERVVVFLDV
jgi:F0F1-type ATP synthase epsilon subunit